MQKSHPKAILAAIMLVSLLGTAGIALPYPLLSPYFMSGSDDPLIHFMGLEPKLLLGITLATYPLGLLIGSKVIRLQVSTFCLTNVIIVIVGSVVALISTTTTLWLAAGLILLSVFAFVTPQRQAETDTHDSSDSGKKISEA